nr:hypothetical protein [Kibdelosporangium sp. MJ126-NF4]
MTWAGLRRPRTWDTVVATDLDPARAAALAGAAEVDVVVLATWSRRVSARTNPARANCRGPCSRPAG